MTQILLWDVMGTLVHDPFFAEMPEFFGMSFEDLLRAKHPTAWVEFELGRRSEPSFLDDFFEDRRAFDQAGFLRAVGDSYRWLPGMEELLAELCDAGNPMHAFSNYPIWYRMIEDRLGLARYLHWTFVSCLIGLRKPDLAAYAHVVDTLGVPAESCVFIDDRQSNVRAARESGLQGVLFEGVDPLRRALTQVGVL